jgi:hypothetical protein
VAQTALISRLLLISVVALVFSGSTLAQSPKSIRDILDALGEESFASVRPVDDSLEPLGSLDSLDLRGRHRFVLPLPRAEAKQGSQRLRETLQRLGILEDVTSALEAAINRAASRANEAAARGEARWSERLRRRAMGLRSALETVQDKGGEAKVAWSWDRVQISKAREPLSLLAWNSGAYRVATTTHFSVASQAGDQPTAEMAQACELAYEIWSQLFAENFGSEQVDAPKSNGADGRVPFRVVMFRTRDAYVKALRAIEPKIGVSTGYYSPRHRMSFFYWDGSKSLPTLVHELTHQFFQEWDGEQSGFDSDRDPGFWAVEGVALYLESFSIVKIGGVAVIDIGGWDSSRLQAGRYRRLRDEYWVAWDEFSQLDGKAFRESKEIAAWYSQACGLAHRWLDGSEGEFAQFTEYLRAVYAGNGSEAALALAKDDDAMRTGYDQYLLTSWRSGDEAGTRAFFPNRREAVLSRCEVASPDLLAWPNECRQMDWLDVSFSQVDDRWLLDAGKHPWKIARLSLESTATSDAAMPAIGSMKELKELDLTACKITDEGVSELREHPALRQLWLGQTQITDASIEVLLSIPRLERLTVDGSRISDAAWKRILEKKPYLKR